LGVRRQIERLNAGLLSAALGAAVQHIGGGVVAVEEGPDGMVKASVANTSNESDDRTRRSNTRRSDHRNRIRNRIGALAESQDAIAGIAMERKL